MSFSQREWYEANDTKCTGGKRHLTDKCFLLRVMTIRERGYILLNLLEISVKDYQVFFATQIRNVALWSLARER